MMGTTSLIFASSLEIGRFGWRIFKIALYLDCGFTFDLLSLLLYMIIGGVVPC